MIIQSGFFYVWYCDAVRFASLFDCEEFNAVSEVVINIVGTVKFFKIYYIDVFIIFYAYHIPIYFGGVFFLHIYFQCVGLFEPGYFKINYCTVEITILLYSVWGGERY